MVPKFRVGDNIIYLQYDVNTSNTFQEWKGVVTDVWLFEGHQDDGIFPPNIFYKLPSLGYKIEIDDPLFYETHIVYKQIDLIVTDIRLKLNVEVMRDNKLTELGI